MGEQPAPLDTIAFRCRDEVIRRYVEAEFGERFRTVLGKQKTAGGRNLVLRRMNAQMAGEAKRQKWYDYEETGDGDFVPHRRQIKRDADGAPVLLVPQVVLARA